MNSIPVGLKKIHKNFSTIDLFKINYPSSFGGNMNNKLYYSVLLLMVGLLFVPTVVMGATTTTTFNVQTNLIASCTVTASNINFGDLTDALGAFTTGTGDVSVTCPSSVAYAISLNAGQNPSPDNFIRNMKKSDGTGQVLYMLYADTSMSIPINYDTAFVRDEGTGSVQPHTIYGMARTPPVSQPLGLYSDVVTVTVTY